MKHSHTQWLAVAALMLALTSPLAAQPTAALKHPAFAADERPDAKAARELRRLGYRHVTAMTGGYKDWKELGYPTAQPTMPPSTSAP